MVTNPPRSLSLFLSLFLSLSLVSLSHTHSECVCVYRGGVFHRDLIRDQFVSFYIISTVTICPLELISNVKLSESEALDLLLGREPQKHVALHAVYL